jgi:hypothetical protein
MKVIKYNKKLVNNVILGSSLFGSSVGIITTVQGTSTPPNQEQDVHQYDKEPTLTNEEQDNKGQSVHQYDTEATEQLRALRSKLAPVEEWIKWVDREKGANPNGEIGCLVPLEEAILRSNLEAVDILIKRGADVNRIVGPRIIEDRYGNKREKYGRILLHLAVYSPEKMCNLWNSHTIQMDPNSIQTQQRNINTVPILHASTVIVDLLLRNMPREKIHASENGSTGKTPLNLALANSNKLRNGIEKGEYDAKEYTPILKEYEAIFDLLQKYAPLQTPPGAQRIPSWCNPTPLVQLWHGKK